MTRLVLIGAGHAHLEVLRRFALQPPAEIAVTLVSRGSSVACSAMLPGVIAGHYAPDAAMIPVAPLAQAAGATLVIGEADRLDPAAGQVGVTGTGPLPFDLLSLDIGGASAAPAGPRDLALRPMEGFAGTLAAAEARLPEGARVAVLGGGLAGIEVALALQHRWASAGRRAVITLFERGPEIVPDMPAGVRRRLHAAFAAKGIEIRTGVTARPEADLRLWATGVGAPGWLGGTGLQLDEDGFVLIDAQLRSLSHPAIFAAGDVAAMAATPRPKTGVIAVRQGPVLAENLRRAATGQGLRRFRPQRNWLMLIATGKRHAIGARNGITVEGDWVWRWKDRIDRRFVARYRDGLHG